MKTLVFYHYLYPDDVVSSVHFSDLCQGLVERGWDVTGYCCTRSCRDPHLTFPPATTWNGVKIKRIWRPGFSQSSSFGRLLNSLWMIAMWSLLAFNPFLRVSQLVVGTDPVLSILVAIPWKLIRPRVRIAHWCFDLYPEAAIADEIISENGFIARTLKWFLKAAYRQCDLVADLGPCMKARLTSYVGPKQPLKTVPVWAIVEPEAPVSVDETERKSLFGDARLALLYSGNFGKAHSYKEVLDVAAGFSSIEAKFVFGARGNGLGELTEAIKAGPPNVKMAGFTSLEGLEKRLSAADVHIVTLRSDWTGTVIPSKFFGAIAAGRPVLFIGSASAGVASWVKEFEVGWVLDTQTSSGSNYQLEVGRIVGELKELAEDRTRLEKLFSHCHGVYQAHFSKQRILDRWHQELRTLASGDTPSFALGLSTVLPDNSSRVANSSFLNPLHAEPGGERGHRP
jgi:glycosyltransferase involved in cell wall biosynthesis